jgi:hypothetical protein
MRFRVRPEALLLAACLVAAPPARAEAPLTRDTVDERARALAELPGLRGSKVERHLKLKFDDEPTPQPKKTEVPDWVRWLRDFGEWLNTTGRFLMWALAAGAAVLVLLRLARWLRGRDEALPQALARPTHVRELDIRPDSLPADIGAAALALWGAGETRGAMSLLYRGALSALVHRHAVPIRASSTEGDCLALARPRLAAPAQAYLEGLVGAWRQTVYAGRPPADADAEQLCAGFAARFAPVEAAA